MAHFGGKNKWNDGSKGFGLLVESSKKWWELGHKAQCHGLVLMGILEKKMCNDKG